MESTKKRTGPAGAGRNRLKSTPAVNSLQPDLNRTDPNRVPAPRTAADALYLHLPFCFHKCHYCDFYSVVDHPQPHPGTDPPSTALPPATQAPPDRQPGFTTALLAELDVAASDSAAPLHPRTVFAGGGTPTFLRPELWAQLLAALHHHDVLRDTTEFTVEANPETVTPALIEQLAAGGVNRVSIGAQSFQKESLDALERWHRPESVGQAVDACRAAGLINFSLDLIFAIPGQTLAMLDADLDRLLELEPTHLSTYGLTYEPQTPLTARLRVGRVTPIDEDTERKMYARVLERLEAAGFEHLRSQQLGPQDRRSPLPLRPQPRLLDQPELDRPGPRRRQPRRRPPVAQRAQLEPLPRRPRSPPHRRPRTPRPGPARRRTPHARSAPQRRHRAAMGR